MTSLFVIIKHEFQVGTDHAESFISNVPPVLSDNKMRISQNDFSFLGLPLWYFAYEWYGEIIEMAGTPNATAKAIMSILLRTGEVGALLPLGSEITRVL